MTAAVLTQMGQASTAVDVREQGWAWVRDAQGGDRAAFEQLYRRYEPSVRRFIRYRVRPSDRAGDLVDDLVSETFLVAWRQMSFVYEHGCPSECPCGRRTGWQCPARREGCDFEYLERLREGGYDVLTWLRSTARGMVGNHYKRASSRREQSTDFGVDYRGDWASGYGNPERDVLAAIDREALAAAVDEAMATLSPDQVGIVCLRDLDGASVAETVAASGRGVRACESLLARGHRRLAEALDPHGEPGPGRSRRALEHARTAHAQRQRTRPGTRPASRPAVRCASPVDARAAAEAFTAELRRRREAAGYSQQRLSLALGYGRAAVCAAERGYKLVGREFAERADQHLGADGALFARWEAAHTARNRQRRQHAVTVLRCNQGTQPPPAPARREQGPAARRFLAQLRHWRETAGYSQRELARQLGHGNAYVSKAEKGERGVSRSFAERADHHLRAGGALVAAWDAAHAERTGQAERAVA